MEEVRSFGAGDRSPHTLDLRPRAAADQLDSQRFSPRKPPLPIQPVQSAVAPIDSLQPDPAVHPQEKTMSPTATWQGAEINLTIRRHRVRRAGAGAAVIALFLAGAFQVNLLWPRTNLGVHLPAPSAAAAAQKTPAPTTPAAPSEQIALQQFVNSYVATQPAGVYAVDVKDLTTGAEATSRADVSMLSASLYKLFVAQIVYERISQGRIELSDPISGETVQGCLSDMITWSDNTCGMALGTLIGWGSNDGELHALGYTDTTLAYPQQTSARDVTLLLQRVADGTFVDKTSSAEMYTLLSEQQINNRLPADLPGVKIAHKTGDLYNFLHDVGIVDGPKGKYIISVMTGPWPDLTNADSSIAEFSKETYQFFQSH